MEWVWFATCLYFHVEAWGTAVIKYALEPRKTLRVVDPACNLKSPATRNMDGAHVYVRRTKCSPVHKCKPGGVHKKICLRTTHTSDTYSSGWQRLLITNQNSALREEVAVDAVAPSDEVREGLQDARDGHGPAKGGAQAADQNISCHTQSVVITCLCAC